MIHSTTDSAFAQNHSYIVGAQSAQRPFVSPENVKGHLRLLREFHRLKVVVEDCEDRRIPGYAVRMDKDTRWRWFVRLAVERFEGWVKSLQFVPLERFVTSHVPPLDVWMVWHAYLLSPSWYAEDCERLEVLKQLRLLNMLVVGSINISKVVRQKPSDTRVQAWRRQTGTAFDPFDAVAMAGDTFKQLACPRCRTQVYVPFVNDDGTGFAEEDFLTMCPLPGCRLRIGHDTLAVAKFVRDLSEGDDEAQEHFVAGSLFTPSGKRDARHAKVIKDQLMRSAYFAGLRPSALNGRLDRLDQVKEAKANIGYSLERLKAAISTSLKNCSVASVTRILNAYTDGSPFSIHLVDAVLRQCDFTAQMDELGWLKPGAFHGAEKREILEHSVVRYHAFLDLMTVYPNSMLVPTLDIDLVWHTHQLMADRYNIDCEMYVGHYVDHELSVTESRLSSAFEDTCRAWQTRFLTPYMQCGCPLPDGTSTHRFMRIVRHFIRGRSPLQADLHPGHLPATHPSSHNALLTFQTVHTGTFGKKQHAPRGKPKEEKICPSVPLSEWVCKKFERPTQLDSEWLPPMRSPEIPVYFEEELPAFPSSFLHDERGSALQYLSLAM